jgi:SAM-dependent methyltransferase
MTSDELQSKDWVVHDGIWDDYAAYCDHVVARSKTYCTAVSVLIGETGPLAPIRPGSCVLDLGCGTGNVTRALVDSVPGLTVIAVDNNPKMVAVFRKKMQDWLRRDAHGPGVLFVETGIDESLVSIGLENLSPSHAILNNVLFVLPDPLKTLSLIAASLHPKGEIRLTGPHRGSNVDALFATLRADLEEAGVLTEVVEDFDRVYKINKYGLGGVIHRFGVKDVEDLLYRAGFKSILYSTTDYYGGQSMLICAQI